MRSDVQQTRSDRLGQLTNAIGVYALCDLDDVPIYVGQSKDGIRNRVRRHLTSARSDIIANRQIDVWEIASVRAWEVETIAELDILEAHIFHHYDSECPLMNGSIPATPEKLFESVPDYTEVRVITDEELDDRKKPEARLPRQIMQYLTLVDYILNVKDGPHLKRSLDAHFERLRSYHASFLE
jgi:hypothetical protein